MPAKPSDGVVIPYACHAGSPICRENETSAEPRLGAQDRKARRRFPRSTVRLTRPKLVNDQRLDEDRALGDGDSLLAFFEYPKGIAKVDRDAIGAMKHVSFACGPTRYREIVERLKANGVTINAGPLLVIRKR